ncbi:hypothetical protein ACQ4PT_005542 [Festuca glaucescens]
MSLSCIRVALVPLLLTMLAQTTSAAVMSSNHQASALLRLKRSFSSSNSAPCFQSWLAGTDCCSWDGVVCGGTDDRVTSLDLGGCKLQAAAGLDAALFSLTSLKHLDLSGNDFNVSQLPPVGFEWLTQLTHLDLSDTNFAGRIPAGIKRLTSLLYLDFSTSFFDFEYDNQNMVTYSTSTSFIQLSEPNLEGLLANLTDLQELRMGMVNMSGNGAGWCDAIAKSTIKLQVLSLPYCSLAGPICGSLSALRSLNVIDLQRNRLPGQVPEFLAGFSNLSVLQLSRNKLQGLFPPTIFQHTRLTTIDLSKNLGISGTLPNFFPVDSMLQKLSVRRTNFSGTIPSSIGHLKFLNKLDLGANGFTGLLPSSLGKLKSLDSLTVSGLKLVGSMPSWISNLTSLTVLHFLDCGLSGPIPSFIGSSRKLTTLALYNCRFSGELPPHILNLTRLEILLLHSNNFVGTVELNSFSKLQNLSTLNLSNNKLVVIDGENNNSSSPQAQLVFLRLASCSISSFPNILRNLNQIRGLDLSDNQIHGTIPQWAWKTWENFDFLLLNLSHNKFSSLGSHPVLPLYIEYFDLSSNYFQGPIPIPQEGSFTLDYSTNQFSYIPPGFSDHIDSTLVFLKASRNNLTGNIPPSICQARSLQLIDLSYNSLSGPIPSCLIEELSALQVLNLGENQLVGKLPDNIKEGCMLGSLDFSGNSIEGKIPRSLIACRNLEILDIGRNHISDSFPCWMSKLPKLQVLVLKSNKFSGHILGPSYTGDGLNCEFTKLRIADMASNNFSGTLPEGWFKMLKSMMARSDNDTLVMGNDYYHGQTYQFTAALTYKGNDMMISKILRTFVLIDVSSNAFHGSIPQAIGELVLLHGLNMSHNSLTGPIPTQFGNLNQLESLDLSWNELSGEIPDDLASLNFLSAMNMSYNMLAGKIPDYSQFSTFSNSSFLGNTGLCGSPLSEQCSNLTETSFTSYTSEERSVDVLLFLSTAVGYGISFAITIIVIWGRHNRKQHWLFKKFLLGGDLQF